VPCGRVGRRVARSCQEGGGAPRGDADVAYRTRTDDSVGHAAYRASLEDVINGDEAYGMSSQVLCSVIRLATHPRVYVVPSRLDDALAFARVLLEQPHCTLVTPGARHYSIFEDLSRKSVANGNLVQDAWLRRSQWRPAATGSPRTAISPASTACDGGARSEASRPVGPPSPRAGGTPHQKLKRTANCPARGPPDPNVCPTRWFA
jgi:predicted nucleic acid-binding protein